jgi:hypothetical protein
MCGTCVVCGVIRHTVVAWVCAIVSAAQRYAQQAALELPKTGMVVAADIGDAASAVHREQLHCGVLCSIV